MRYSYLSMSPDCSADILATSLLRSCLTLSPSIILFFFLPPPTLYIYCVRFFRNRSELSEGTLREKCPNTEFPDPYFHAFGLNTERYVVSLHTQSECRKIRARKNSVFGHFSRSGRVSATIKEKGSSVFSF